MIKKIGWFKRMFKSWKYLKQYIESGVSESGVSEEFLKNLKQPYEEMNKILKDQNIESEISIKSLKEKLSKYEYDKGNDKALLSQKYQNISSLQVQLAEVKAELNGKNNSYDIQEKIHEKLSTITKIEKTFFGTTGPQGKGKLGEMQVKTILDKSGLTKCFWTEDLPVGTGHVEFAIKSGGESGKWIPVDSKVLVPSINEGDNTIVIDEKYVTRVKTAAKKISKYLNKKNTAGYGILVLPSDSIYITLFDKYPSLFKDVLSEYKIRVSSPANFVQSAWSISQIVDIYEKVRNDEKTYLKVISLLDTAANFAKSLSKVHIDFNIAMTKHYPSLENKHSILYKELEKIPGKMKKIDALGVKPE